MQQLGKKKLTLPTAWVIVSALLLVACSSKPTSSGYLAAQSNLQRSIKSDSWLIQSQLSSGKLPYYFKPSDGRLDSQDSLMVQIMAAERLTKLAHDRPRFEPAVNALIAHISDFFLTIDESEKKRPVGKKTTLGEQAALLRLLLLYTKSTVLSEHSEKLATNLRRSFNSDQGFVETPQVEQGTSLFMSRYYTGHASLALLKHSIASGNTDSREIAASALDWLANKYPINDDQYFHPALVPFHAFSIAQQYWQTGSSHHINTLFYMADKLQDLQSESEFPGRFFDPKEPQYGPPNVVRDALSTLTLMEALAIAEIEGDRSRVKQYQQSIWLALDNLNSLQYDHGVVSGFPRPDKAVGALRFRHNDERIRLDGVIFGAEVFERAALLIQSGKL